MNKVYVALFRGMGGALLSPGIDHLGEKLSQAAETGVYDYEDYPRALVNLRMARIAGRKTVLIGFSAGCSTITMLQSRMRVHSDLLISMAESMLTINYPINKEVTKRSILYHGNFPLDFMSAAGLDSGYDVVRETNMFHLGIQLMPWIQDEIMKEVENLR